MMAAIGTFTFEFEVSLPLLARDTHVGREPGRIPAETSFLDSATCAATGYGAQ